MRKTMRRLAVLCGLIALNFGLWAFTTPASQWGICKVGFVGEDPFTCFCSSILAAECSSYEDCEELYPEIWENLCIF